MPLMRSAGVSLLLMSRPAYVRCATMPVEQTVVEPADTEAAYPSRHEAAIARGGFGQLGDCLLLSDVATA